MQMVTTALVLLDFKKANELAHKKGLEQRSTHDNHQINVNNFY